MESRLVSSLTRCSWLVVVIDEERSSLESTVEPWSTHGRGYSVSKSLLFSGPHCLHEIVLFFRLFLFFLFSKFLSLCALLFFLHFFFSASFYFRPNVSYFVFLIVFFCSHVLLVLFVFVMFSSFLVSFLGLVLLVVVLLLMSLFFQLFFVLLFFLLFVYFSYLFLFSLNIRARLLRSLTD